MADSVTLVSTTDSPEQVQEALTGTVTPPPVEPATPPAAEVPPVAPTPAAEVPPAVTPPEPDPAAPAGETPEQKTARGRREKIQDEIDKLTRKKHDIRRDVEAEEARLKTLQKDLTDLVAKGAVPAAPPVEPVATTPAVTVQPDRPQPQLADTTADGKAKYANYEEWVADLGTWNREIAKKEANVELEARLKADRAERDKQAADDRARIDAESANRVVNESLAKHNDRIEDFKKTHADFDAVIAGVADTVVEMKGDFAAHTGQPGERLFEVIDKFVLEDSVNSPALVYYLAQHPDEMSQIVRLPVARQLIALGRLDSRLEGAVPPQPGPPVKVTPTTKAPEPIKPVGGGPTAPSTVTGENESYAEYKARRDREERVRLGLPVTA